MRLSWIVGLGGLALLAGCREPNQFQAPPPPTVTVANPEQQTITPALEAVGRTEALISVDIRARVRGFLKSVEFDEGVFVNEGDLLYTIEPEEYEAALASAKASEAEARARVTQTEDTFARIKDLMDRANASEQEFFDAKANQESAAAALMAAEALIKSAQLNLDYTQIHAPISGKINRTEVNVGNLVGQNEPTLLTTVVTWDPIAVYFNVSERDVLDFRRRHGGTKDKPETLPVQMRLSDGSIYEHEGKIDYADNEVDPTTGTLRVRAIFPNPDLLLVPGVFGRVLVPEDPVSGLLVPETCLQRDLAGYFVLTVGADGTVARVDVETGPAEDGMRMISKGLTAEQRVITRGLQRVRPGLKVNATEAGEAPPAPVAPTSQPAGEGDA